MEQKKDPKSSSAEVENSPKDGELEVLRQTLEQQQAWDGGRLFKYDGFWYREMILRSILSSQKHFKAKDSDIILSSIPKSGTTWLKALTFSIVNRHRFAIDQSPLLTANPHKLVPILEFDIYLDHENPDLEHIPCPRIFSTHRPFNALPESILESESRIIYICRNPLDQFISHRHFLLGNDEAIERIIQTDAVPLELDAAVDKICQGILPFGPFWDHMLGHWNAHLKNPHKVLFLKYEDLKEDITIHVKKIAEFLEFPFSVEEEKQGRIEQISTLCSFEKLSSLEVNKTGDLRGLTKNSSFFRKGEVGDWTNHLTPAMAERIKKVVESKLEGSGLTFKTLNK